MQASSVCSQELTFLFNMKLHGREGNLDGGNVTACAMSVCILVWFFSVQNVSNLKNLAFASLLQGS